MKLREIFLAVALLVNSNLAEAKPIAIQVKGMVCAFCAQGIEKKFKSLSEVAAVKVSLETKMVSLDIKDGKDLSDGQIKTIISDAGYDVVKIERPK